MASAVGIVHARVEGSTLEQLRANAHANDRTLAQEVRRALRMYAQMLEQQRGARTNVQPGSSHVELAPIAEP